MFYNSAELLALFRGKQRPIARALNISRTTVNKHIFDKGLVVYNGDVYVKISEIDQKAFDGARSRKQ